MNRPICLACICAIVAIAFAHQNSASSKQPDDKPLKITAAELRRATILGDLGVPIGTIVTIEGKFQDMTFTRAKLDDGRFDLVIEHVNGKALKESVRFNFGRPRSGEEDGAIFKIVGYERGAFEGYIKGEGKFDTEDDRMVARNFPPFDYYSEFIVLKNQTVQQRQSK